MKNLLVTGYRASELGIFNQKHPGIPFIREAIKRRLIPLIEEGLEWVITPGQYGVDLWACEAVIELKKEYPQLRLSVLAAFANMDEKWSDEKKEYWQELLKGIDYYGLVSKEPYSGPWQFKARDALLLRKTGGMLLVYDDEAAPGSPRYFKEDAEKMRDGEGYLLIQITPEDIQSVADDMQSELADTQGGDWG
ncbi:DUF1273 domain-containing protein [Saccharibacillus sp. CPCC 101409]|uniref:DUF1273 domain-containing protein n=1 Tax=Saccharibacillus sp. CPCC 101409 TaxID=3058041 RepID=UPI0026724BBB|nr:DUF1273 domain-containing protein [Saccharibacillus sp. CPCC 101409]MDO3408238.1 DUF1273 domain-containing protein [Saccharibacillus sp. CPCC 101409]